MFIIEFYLIRLKINSLIQEIGLIYCKKRAFGICNCWTQDAYYRPTIP